MTSETHSSVKPATNYAKTVADCPQNQSGKNGLKQHQVIGVQQRTDIWTLVIMKFAYKYEREGRIEVVKANNIHEGARLMKAKTGKSLHHCKLFMGILL